MQDPNSWKVFPVSNCPNGPNHLGIIFDSGWDPRSEIQDSWERLLGNLGSWIPARIKNYSKMIRASTGSKIPWEDLPGILDFGFQHESKMILKI